MAWMKVDAARKYAGGLGRKVLYRAVASGHLKAARIGAGRSLLFSDSWIDDWLVASASRKESDKGLVDLAGREGEDRTGARRLRLVGRR